jgi:hypothetical protein
LSLLILQRPWGPLLIKMIYVEHLNTIGVFGTYRGGVIDKRQCWYQRI